MNCGNMSSMSFILVISLYLIRDIGAAATISATTTTVENNAGVSLKTTKPSAIKTKPTIPLTDNIMIVLSSIYISTCVECKNNMNPILSAGTSIYILSFISCNMQTPPKLDSIIFITENNEIINNGAAMRRPV